jgi:hypothetical protein
MCSQVLAIGYCKLHLGLAKRSRAILYSCLEDGKGIQDVILTEKRRDGVALFLTLGETMGSPPVIHAWS